MFRFTIRDVLWLTTLVAVLGAWWVDHLTIRRERDRSRLVFSILTTHLEMLGYKVKVVSDPAGGDDQLDVQRPDGGAMIRIPETR